LFVARIVDEDGVAVGVHDVGYTNMAFQNDLESGGTLVETQMVEQPHLTPVKGTVYTLEHQALSTMVSQGN